MSFPVWYIVECNFLRPNPWQQCKFNVFHVVGGVSTLSEQPSQPSRQGRTECFLRLYRVVFCSLFPCSLSHNQNVYIALLFGIPKQFGVPYYASSYIHITYTHTCVVSSCGVVPPPVPKCHAVFFSLLPSSKCNKASTGSLQTSSRALLSSWSENLKALHSWCLPFLPQPPFTIWNSCVLPPHRSLPQS